MEITSVLANSSPSALFLKMLNDHLPSYTFWFEFIHANLWLQSAGVAVQRTLTLVFYFRLLAGTPTQSDLVPKEKSRNLMVFWSSCFASLQVWFCWPRIKVINREQAPRGSTLKPSVGPSKNWRSTLFSISSNMLLQFNLERRRRDLLRSALLHLVLMCTLNPDLF